MVTEPVKIGVTSQSKDSMRHLVWSTSVLAAFGLTACDNTSPDPAGDLAPAAQLSRPATRYSDFTPLASAASCIVPPSTLADFATYHPFELPAGYSQKILADEVVDFAVAGTGANLPDMLTLNESGPDANRYVYRTHEVGSNGAVTRTDLQTGQTIVVAQQQHYEALDGIDWTPWGTLLFAEERIVASFKDPQVPNAVGGLLYEYDPATGVSTPRPAFGARSHEGLRFDRAGNLYGISESTPGVNGSGALYKFVPDRPGDLRTGQLYALKVLDASRVGQAVWVRLNRDDVRVNSDDAAIKAGATGWARPEDIEFVKTRFGSNAETMYVTSTSEALVLRIDLVTSTTAFVSNFVKEGVNVTGLDNPDNLEVDANGNVYIIEDNGPGDIWMAKNTTRPRVATEVVRFASLSDCAAEPTGFYFAPSGLKAWVHVQHAGGALQNDLFLEITKDIR